MKNELIERIKVFLEDEDYTQNLATDEEINRAENLLKVSFDSDYKQFIKLFGGAYVGYSIYSFKNLNDLENVDIIELNKSFENQGIPDFEDKYVISFDGSGSPIMIDSGGKILLFDHDNGEYVVLADSFEKLIEDNLPD